MPLPFAMANWSLHQGAAGGLWREVAKSGGWRSFSAEAMPGTYSIDRQSVPPYPLRLFDSSLTNRPARASWLRSAWQPKTTKMPGREDPEDVDGVRISEEKAGESPAFWAPLFSIPEAAH